MTIDSGLNGLSETDLAAIIACASAFDAGWTSEGLEEAARTLPKDPAARRAGLEALIKVDIKHRHGAKAIEEYLVVFSELGNASRISADLIFEEFQACLSSGRTTTVESYFRRFPDQSAAFGELVQKARAAVGEWEPPSGELPARFGKYTLIKRLGQGGMGSVYLASDDQLERMVALKLPTFGPGDDGEIRARFLTEARAAASLNHPYLCQVFDYGEVNGRPYLKMAYIEGQSLAELIRDHGVPQKQAATLVGKLALALQDAHNRGVVHRDLKPANVMLKQSGGRREPVIVDFGLARRLDAGGDRVTMPGQIMGTLAYMAPEQLRGEIDVIGPRSDIYSLGVILYELLTGRLPFQGAGFAVMGQILTEQPTRPVQLRPDLDPNLEAICLKAMSRHANARYQTMTELASALTSWIKAGPASGMSEIPIAKTPEKEQVHESREKDERKRDETGDKNTTTGGKSRWIWPVVAASTIGVVGIGIYFSGLFGGKGTPSDPIAAQATEVIVSKARPPEDALALVEVERNVRSGEWKRLGKSLSSVAGQTGFVIVPFELPSEYIVRASVAYLGGDEGLAIGLQRGQRRFAVVLDSHGGTISGLSLVGGEPAEANATKHEGRVLPARLNSRKGGAVSTDVVITVTSKLIDVKVAGNSVVHYTGPDEHLDIAKAAPKRVNSRFLNIVTPDGGAYRFETLTVEDISK